MKSALVQIGGHLDLASGAYVADPGSASYCLNYEVANTAGARRIEGFARWDGRVMFFAAPLIINIASDPDGTPTGWVIGNQVVVTLETDAGAFSVGIDATVIDASDDEDPPGTYIHSGTFVLTENLPEKIVKALQNNEAVTVVSITGGPTVTPGNVPISISSGTALEPYYQALVTQVPGNNLVKIPGIHFFRDKVYAVVDLVAALVTPVSGTQLLQEGAPISTSSGGPVIATVARIRPGASDTESIVDLFDCSTSLSSSTDFYVGTTKVADVVTTQSSEKAALYSAEYNGPGGWTRIDLGRFLAYNENGSGSDPNAFFLPYIRRGFVDQFATAEERDTGWIDAQSWEEFGGGFGWTGGASDLTTDDDVFVASATTSTGNFTKTLKVKFGALLSAVPDGSLVRGVEVEIRRRRQGGTGAFDRNVYLSKATGTGLNKANQGLNIPTVEAAATYGSSTDLWGLSLTQDEISSTDFAVNIDYSQNANSNLQLDQVRIKVRYQSQTRLCYVRDTVNSVDLAVTVLHFTVSQGTSTGGTNGDRRGLIVIDPAVGTAYSRSGGTHRMAPNLPIRSQSGGLGDILANTASIDEPILLPSSTAIVREDAQYMFDTASPYGADDSEVFFICSGAEYAYMFDGQYALPIQTGLAEQYEKPRHVVWAGNYLALGYRTGSVALSDLGDPLTYVSSSSIAAEIGASDRVTALLKLKGDSLGVGTERTIFALQGTDPQSLVKVMISPSSGVIEYSAVDMGQPMFADYRGIATLQTTDRYGDFDRGRVSWQATTWLIERLQSPRSVQTNDRRARRGYACRNKNQFRLAFNDGWQSTATLAGNDGEVRISTQRFYGDYQNQDTTAIRFLSITTGVTSGGRDVMFATFDVDSESRYRYVFALDIGNSFDLEEIRSTLILNPNQLGSPNMLKQINSVSVQGRATDFATLNVAMATDFTDPVIDSVQYEVTFGDVATNASGVERNYKDMLSGLRGGNGDDFAFLFDCVSATQNPHVIQSLIINYQPPSEKR